MIRLSKICRIHRTDEVQTTALSDIELTIEKGDFLSIMGPSGCGKSTLLNVIGLLDTPSSGHYYFNDEQLAQYTESQRAVVRKNNIGVIFQSFNLIDELTVGENVELALLYQKVPSGARRQRVATVLKKLGVDARARHYPQQLSGGQQQRVAIARAIVGGPKLLLADEPTGNLDSKNGDEVMAELASLNAGGTTVVIVTHSEEHANYASRIVRMLDGKILDSESTGSAAKRQAVTTQVSGEG